MSKQVTKRIALGATVSLMLIATVPRFVGAMSIENTETDQNNTTTLREEAKKLREEKQKEAEKLREEKKAEAEKLREEKKQSALEKRDTKMAEMCQKHQERITQLMQRIDARSQHNYERLGKITDLVKGFYEKKNLSVENYAELVADIETKQATAKEKLDMMLEHGQFSCDADSPREVVKEYRADRQTKVEAMKAYREAVRALLIEVRKAAVEAASENPTPAKTEEEAQ